MTGKWRMVFVMAAASTSGGYSHSRRADAMGSDASIRRCHRYPDPQAFTWIVGQARHVHVAAPPATAPATVAALRPSPLPTVLPSTPPTIAPSTVPPVWLLSSRVTVCG